MKIYHEPHRDRFHQRNEPEKMEEKGKTTEDMLEQLGKEYAIIDRITAQRRVGRKMMSGPVAGPKLNVGAGRERYGIRDKEVL